MLFRKEHIDKILRGEKTQTRRRSRYQYKVGRTYRIQRSWYNYTDIKILITRRYKQRLGDITQKEVRKEGYSSLEEFKQAWITINGYWDPDEIVTVYEFKLVDPNPSIFIRGH
ncbi:MAG: hypothetical protein DRO00_09770 [Thermoproteota archaeon]|nr:MAG: hypothetical protein DRO00_09770 [Candidatus Korarchaeota archaeon]